MTAATLVVLGSIVAACKPDAPPAEKLGSDDLIERPVVAKADELAPLWRAVFVEGTAWKIGDVTCHADPVKRIFGGWLAYVRCARDDHDLLGAALDGIFVANGENLWRAETEIDDIRKVDPGQRMIPPAAEYAVRTIRDDTCIQHTKLPAATICLRAYAGIVGGSFESQRFGVMPSSW